MGETVFLTTLSVFLLGISLVGALEWRERWRERSARRLVRAALHLQERRSELRTCEKRMQWVMVRMQRDHPRLSFEKMTELIDAAFYEVENERAVAHITYGPPAQRSPARGVLYARAESWDGGP